MTIPTLKDSILAKEPSFWLPKVERVLRHFWDEEALRDLPQRFSLLWEEINSIEASYCHHVLVDYLGNKEKGPMKLFSVFDEDFIVEFFELIPAWDEILLEPWEGSGPLLEELESEAADLLLLKKEQMLTPETRDLNQLSVFLSSRLPAYCRYRRERLIVIFLSSLLHDRDQKHDLYALISEYRAIKTLRETILLRDI